MRILARWCLVVVAALMFAACGKDAEITTSQPPDNFNAYSREIDPSLSPDRGTVYFIGVDTLHPDSCAVGTARVSQPVRNYLVRGTRLRSPSLSPSGRYVTYLASGFIRLYNVTAAKDSATTLTDTYENVAFVSDTLLVAGRVKNLYTINLRSGVVTLWGEGYDPTFYKRGAFLATLPVSGGSNWALANVSPAPPASTNLVRVGGGQPRWPSTDQSPTRHDFVFTRTSGGSYDICHADSVGTVRVIGTTSYPRALLVAYDLVIYTGPDGRLWHMYTTGDGQLPWIYVKQ